MTDGDEGGFSQSKRSAANPPSQAAQRVGGAGVRRRNDGLFRIILSIGVASSIDVTPSAVGACVWRTALVQGALPTHISLAQEIRIAASAFLPRLSLERQGPSLRFGRTAWVCAHGGLGTARNPAPLPDPNETAYDPSSPTLGAPAMAGCRAAVCRHPVAVGLRWRFERRHTRHQPRRRTTGSARSTARHQADPALCALTLPCTLARLRPT